MSTRSTGTARRRLLRSAGAVAVAGLLVSACGGSSSTSKSSASGLSGPVNVVGILGLTGTFGAYGAGDAAGAKAEVALINQSGGVLGHQLKYQTIDDGSLPNKASIAAQQVASTTPFPALVLGGATSVEAAAILPVTTRAKIVTMAPLGTDSLSDPATYPYQFTTVQDATQRVSSIVKAFKELGVQKVGILSSNDTGASTIAKAAAAGLPKGGIDVVGTESVPLTATDMTVQLQALQRKGAKAVYAYFTTPTEYVTMMDGIGTIGWTDVQMVGGESALTASVMAGIPGNVAKQFLVLGPTALGRHGSTVPANVSRFITALQQQGGSTNYLYSSMLAGDTVVLAAWAVEQAHSANPTKVLAELNSLHGVNLPASVKSSLLAMPAPKWSPTDHGLAGADNAGNWSLLEPGPAVSGTYLLSPDNK